MKAQAFKNQADSKGAQPSYAWPGGYPLVYTCRDGGTLCPACVNAESEVVLGSHKHESGDNPDWNVVSCDVHWEGDPLVCDNCNCSVDSAYGD